MLGQIHLHTDVLTGHIVHDMHGLLMVNIINGREDKKRHGDGEREGLRKGGSRRGKEVEREKEKLKRTTNQTNKQTNKATTTKPTTSL